MPFFYFSMTMFCIQQWSDKEKLIGSCWILTTDNIFQADQVQRFWPTEDLSYVVCDLNKCKADNSKEATKGTWGGGVK